jgi:anti-sigma B factor antagonist
MVDIRSDEVRGVIILHLTGRLTVGGSIRGLQEQVGDLLEAGFKKILVDVAGVTHMDSWGVGELLMAREPVLIAGGEMKLLNLDKRERHMPHAMVLAAVFEKFEDESSAILSYSSPKPPDTQALARAENSGEFRWVDGWPRLFGQGG